MSRQPNGHTTDAEPVRAHVMPNFPVEPEHDPDVTCWCEPELIYRDAQTGGETWLHRRLQ